MVLLIDKKPNATIAIRLLRRFGGRTMRGRRFVMRMFLCLLFLDAMRWVADYVYFDVYLRFYYHFWGSAVYIHSATFRLYDFSTFKLKLQTQTQPSNFGLVYYSCAMRAVHGP